MLQIASSVYEHISESVTHRIVLFLHQIHKAVDLGAAEGRFENAKVLVLTDFYLLASISHEWFGQQGCKASKFGSLAYLCTCMV